MTTPSRTQFTPEIMLIDHWKSKAVATAQEAQFLVVPAVCKCMWVALVNKGRNKPRLIEFHKLLFDWLRSKGHLAHRPADHIFISPSGAGRMQFENWNKGASNTGKSIMLGPDAGFTKEYKNAYPYFNFGQDVVIPGYVSKTEIRDLEKEVELRSFLGVYCGDFTRSSHRKQLKTLKGKKNGFFGSCSPNRMVDYFRKSVFCFAPTGLSPWTSRFYKALAAGCIPVLLGRSFVLPFLDRIPWDEFIVRWEDTVNVEVLWTYLSDMPQDELERRRNMIRVYRDLVLWKDGTFLALEASILEKHKRFKRFISPSSQQYHAVEPAETLEASSAATTRPVLTPLPITSQRQCPTTTTVDGIVVFAVGLVALSLMASKMLRRR